MTTTNGAMPRQARKQAEAAIAAQEELIGKPGEAAPDTADPEAQPAGQQPAAEQNLDQPTSPSAGEEPAKQDEVDWEKRFKGAQAAYNRDVPRLRSELEKAQDAVESLRVEMEELRNQVATPATDPTPEPEIGLSDEELEQYGPGLVHVIKTIAEQSKGELAKQVVELKQQLADIGTQQKEIVKTTVLSAEDKFFDAMDRAVPEWETINMEKGFHDFLAEVIPYSGGRTRQQALEAARNGLDSHTAIEIFSDYAKLSSKGSSQTSEPTPDLKVPPELETPRNSGGGAPPVEDKKYYTYAEITQFYKDKREGKYSEEEAKKIDADIFAAGNEGRILTDKAYEKNMRFQEQPTA